MTFPGAFNVVDWVIVGAVVLGGVHGLVRGLSGELAHAVAVVVSVVAGFFLFRPLGALLESISRLHGPNAYAVAFVASVFAVLLVLWLLHLAMKQLLEWSFKGRGERLGGLAAGLLRMVLTLAFIYLLINLWPQDFLYRHMVDQSVLGRGLTRLVLPLYRDLAEDHPDWDLPRAPEEKENDETPNNPMTKEVRSPKPEPFVVCHSSFPWVVGCFVIRHSPRLCP